MFHLHRIISKDFEINLILDEIQSGIGRTGKWWAIEHYGIEPDMVCFAKGIASGLPLGGVIVKSEIMDWSPGTHYSTFGGNPIACAASLEVIKTINKERILSNVTKVGEHIIKVCKELMEKYKIIGDVRGKGLMIGLELVDELKSKKPAVENCKKVLFNCLKRGLLLLRCGMSTIRLIPPLNIDIETGNVALNIIEDVLKEL